jgi:anaerobic selenocysteine-containing dehydrogenase
MPIPTRSTRFELYSNELAEECFFNEASPWKDLKYVYPLPVYIPVAEPKNKDEFYLVSGKATWHQKNATQDNRYLMESGIEGGCPYMPVYLNAQRANELGIKENDLIEIECIWPNKSNEVCVRDDSNIGFKDTVRVHLSEGLHPAVAFTHFASGHKSNMMISKVREGIVHSEFVPLTVEPN